MKKRLFAAVLLICMLLSAVLPMAYATETTEETAVETTAETVEETTEETVKETKKELSTKTSGTCGDDLTWKFEGHTLTISGSGEMDAGCPWEFYKDSIHTVVFDGDITNVGDEAFSSCNNLETVDFGDALVQIGTQAFYSCNALESILLPETFRKFGQECFMDCENLEAIYCLGGMPSFKANCLYNDHTVVVYHTTQYSWPQAEIDRLMSNFGGRVYVQQGNAEVKAAAEGKTEPKTTVTETIVLTEADTEPTEAETVPVLVLVTEPVTEPTTEPTAQPTQPVQATEVTQPETTVPAETQAPATEETEPDTVVEHAGSNGWIWMVIVAACLTGLLVLALVIRGISHKGGKYSE